MLLVCYLELQSRPLLPTYQIMSVYYSPPRVSMDSSWSPHRVHGVPMESSWSPHSPHKVHRVPMESLWSPCGVLMESSQSPWRLRPKSRFYGESMDFGCTIISTLFLAHFLTASTWLKVDAIIPSNIFYILQSHTYTYQLISYMGSTYLIFLLFNVYTFLIFITFIVVS